METIKPKVLLWSALFCVAAVYGTFMEWAVGSIWGRIGDCPYIYPNSPITYSSFLMMPLWGFVGLQAAVIYLAIAQKKPKMLLWLLLLVVLTAILVLILAST